MPQPNRLTRRARQMRRQPTEAENFLWKRIRSRQLGGAKFRRQAPIGPYIVDFCCVDARLIVEIDGGQHGGKKDQERTIWLEEAGFRVIRFWNNEVLNNVEGVLDRISEAL